MQVLLDECLPKDFRKLLPTHQVVTVPEKGWSGVTNGKLLELAQQNGFQVFITVDQNLSAKHPNAGNQLIVIVLRSKSNRLADLQPLGEKAAALLSTGPLAGVYILP